MDRCPDLARLLRGAIHDGYRTPGMLRIPGQGTVAENGRHCGQPFRQALSPTMSHGWSDAAAGESSSRFYELATFSSVAEADISFIGSSVVEKLRMHLVPSHCSGSRRRLLLLRRPGSAEAKLGFGTPPRADGGGGARRPTLPWLVDARSGSSLPPLTSSVQNSRLCFLSVDVI